LIALAQEIGKLPNKISLEGHTDSRPYSRGGNYGNWELSADRANATRRLMQQNSLREDQVVEVRGFADQRLRKNVNPEDPSNRRITLIVKYIEKATTALDDAAVAEAAGESRTNQARQTE
jgi:chemotaxis protein MotB